MKLLITKNGIECVPLSFAMVLGVDIEEIYTYLGHNGTEIVIPEAEPPTCYRGFSPLEIIPFCWKLKYSATHFLLSNLTNYQGKEIQILPTTVAVNNIYHAMNDADGVILGLFGYKKAYHAVAWNSNERLIYDPIGEIYSINTLPISINHYFAITKRI